MLNTETYKYIDTKDMIDTVRNSIHNAGMTIANMSMRGNARQHVVKFTLNQELSLHGDVGKPMIIVTNSTDKSRAFSIMVGFFRLVCSNGLVIGETFYNQKIIHRIGQKADDALIEIPLRVAAALKDIAGTLQDIEDDTAKTLTLDQQIDVIGNLAVSDDVKRSTILRLVKPEYRRPEDQGDTVWHLWNTVQEQLMRGRQSMLAEGQNARLLDDIMFLADMAA